MYHQSVYTQSEAHCVAYKQSPIRITNSLLYPSFVIVVYQSLRSLLSTMDSTTTSEGQVSSLQHFSSLAFEQFQCFRSNQELCDVFLSVDGVHIPAHRLVLAASSPYFRAMFSGKMAESVQKEVFLSDLDGKAVEKIIDFFYSGKVAIDEDNVQSLLYASCLLAVKDVKEYCCDFLQREITVSNCLGIRAIADTLSCSELFEAANLYVTENFSVVLVCEEFLLQPFESLSTLIDSDYLNISGECELLDAVVKWLHWDNLDRARYARSLLKRIYLMKIHVSRLESLLNDSIISTDCECLDLILEALDTLASENVSSAYEFPLFLSRVYGKAMEVLFSIGGESAGVTLDSTECYDLKGNTWDWNISVRDLEPLSLPALEQSRNNATSSTTGRHVYVIGGSYSWKALDVVERYEWPENKWRQLSSLNKGRLGAGSAIVNGQLLVAGGCGEDGYLSSVESYDPLLDKWSLIKPMNQRRSYLGVAELNGYVYAVGGYCGVSGESDGFMASAECYVPSNDMWIPVTPLLQPRAHFGLVAEGGSLYALGGYNSSWLTSLERFDPREGQWYRFPSMKSPRSSAGACSINNCLYIAGGFDGVKNLNSVESFDIRAEKWKQMNPMRTVRFGMCLAACRL
ncbi:kelch-like protein 2 [Actinia tenebrosa]|uniref:Kelch-like protein 2 n=1 Tax=Actinia tenebrosa TaxID=6105 RepID=A0A6P8J6E5_ACTTE|nr:kelch-like protein 2 [Actinia tenebrosa]